MAALWFGVASILLAGVFELLHHARLVFLKRVVVAAAMGSFLCALWCILQQPPTLPLPAWGVPIGIALGVSGALLSVYSLGIELCFSRTYLRTAPAHALVDSGTYALTRHPGVLWLALFLVGLLFACRTHVLLLAAPIWLALDVGLAWWQDRFVFPQQFPEYARYRQNTPMLWPTRTSLERFWRTLPRRPRRT